ncbi:type II toxin-antitoxin system RelE/ParE family toxin [Paludisphaera borealis]|uniref:Type II toxin-antitoxin system RelE/ParE family toxin n=1 Tax=Paludisphaera borealis TaxID=1387353 RepID=A0A1U7CJF9_9BACT|nr:type II toxin-antitoxin system RelE/ParE family toxin [Paludisphaera borealis]APW59046.1 hypothetical protein BSF38_00460 [Paludisphaera borealis]
MSRIVRRIAARLDMVEAYRYYARKAGRRTADRFFARAEATFQRLATFPGAGTVYNPDRPALADLRYFPIARFPNQIVFCKPIPDGVEVYRVLHGARDLEGVFDLEFD